MLNCGTILKSGSSVQPFTSHCCDPGKIVKYHNFIYKKTPECMLNKQPMGSDVKLSWLEKAYSCPVLSTGDLDQ